MEEIFASGTESLGPPGATAWLNPVTDRRECRTRPCARSGTFEGMHSPPAVWAAVTLDCLDPGKVAGFWSGLLDAPARAIDLPGWFRVGPTVAGGPVLTFQPVPEEKVGKTRLHLDLWVNDLDAVIHLVEDLGGTATGERHLYDEGTVVVMADIEGNELCLVGPP